MIDQTINVGVEGFFRLKVYKADGTFTGKDSGWQHNLITNVGLDALATQTNVMDWFHVGTSSTTPLITDTWLNAHQASTNNKIDSISGIYLTQYSYRRVTARFAVGDATGNMSEVAVGWDNVTGTAFMHELIRNASGDAISITVLADEFLEFTYELRYNIPAGDFTGTALIEGVNYNWTMRASNCTNTAAWGSVGFKFDTDTAAGLHHAYTGELGAITTVPAGTTGSDCHTVGKSGYSAGQKYLNFSVSPDTTEWNISGGVLRSFTVGCLQNMWQIRVGKVSDDSGLAKSGSNSLVMNWRIAWDRA